MEVISLSQGVELSVDGIPRRVQAFAADRGDYWHQASVLVFHEDKSGTAARFVFEAIEDLEEAVRLLRRIGPEGGSVGRNSLTLIVVDEREEAKVRALAAALGIKPKRTAGEVVFVGRDGK
jgi:hypothetical protein